uniref:Uncharacterized protein n=1 Tax=Anopheles minimus TaxID=112268 RepID=A0A182WMZ5_9DIPT
MEQSYGKFAESPSTSFIMCVTIERLFTLNFCCRQQKSTAIPATMTTVTDAAFMTHST